MTLYLFDAAYAPSLSAVKRAGGVAMNGYLTGLYANTTAQPAAVRAAGLGFLPTYEEGPAELVGATRSTGQAVGRKILSAFTAKRLPLDGSVAVYPSVDVSVAIDGTDHDADACNEGWRGIRDVIAGKISVRAYAEGAVIDALVNAGLVDGKCWLAAPSSWPGYRPTDANVCVVQEVGSPVGGTDRNHLVTDPHALGAWWPDGSPYGGDMALTNTDVENVWKYRLLMDDGKTTWQANHVLKRAYTQAEAARVDVVELAGRLATLEQLVAGTATQSGVAPRVAEIQAAVASLATAVANLSPTEAVTVDTQAIVDALKALEWRVSA